MIGISDVNVYIPFYYLDQEDFQNNLNVKIHNKKPICNYDEDSITVTVESARTLPIPKNTGAVLFASTTNPYEIKQASTLIATVMDMEENLFCLDIGNSFRAFTSGMRLGVNMLKSSEFENVLLCGGENFSPKPGSTYERLYADGSSSIIMTNSGNVILEYVDSLSTSSEFWDIWKKRTDKFYLEGDQAFVKSYGFPSIMYRAIREITKRTNITVDKIKKFAIQAPDLPQLRQLAKKLDIAKKIKESENILTNYGYFGNATAGILLYETLMNSNAGDIILLGGYGNGNCDVFIFKVTDGVEQFKKRRKNLSAISAPCHPLKYNKYLSFKNLIDSWEKPNPFSTPLILWKEINQDLKLMGSKCKNCGYVFYPVRRVCHECNSKDNFEYYKLSQRGKVYTYTKDHMVPSPNPPVIMVVVDLEGGGRFYGQLTDSPGEIQIGDEVEFTFRYFHSGGGFLNYFWKLKPVK